MQDAEKNFEFDYCPETIEEEYAFLAGRVKALESVMNKISDYSFDKELVASILGMEYPKNRSAPEV